MRVRRGWEAGHVLSSTHPRPPVFGAYGARRDVATSRRMEAHESRVHVILLHPERFPMVAVASRLQDRPPEEMEEAQR